MLPKIPPIRLLIFSKKVPPIRLFPPILLLIFKEISHLYFYSEPSSIRNFRVNHSWSPLLSHQTWQIDSFLWSTYIVLSQESGIGYELLQISIGNLLSIICVRSFKNYSGRLSKNVTYFMETNHEEWNRHRNRRDYLLYFLSFRDSGNIPLQE